MIVRTRGGGQREFRMASPVAQDHIPSPAEFGAWLAAATGERITVDKAASIPAVLNAIRLIAESVASLPMRVYEGTGADKRLADTTWQWRLLHDRPNDEQSPFDFWQDVAACVETHGNAYLLKDLAGRRGENNLYVIDPSIVTVERDRRTYAKTFVIRSRGDDRRQQDPIMRLTSADVLHVRGPTLKGGDKGVSPIALARDALGAAIARSKYEGSAYKNDATPASVIETDEAPNGEKAKRIAAVWYGTHGNTGQAGGTGVLMGGAKLKTYGLSMKDAQFVESHRYSVEDIGRMFSIPPSLLGAGDLGSVEQDTRRFLAFGLGGRLKRIRAAVWADPDIFNNEGLYPEHYTDDFVALDAATLAQMRHYYAQDGVLLKDEIRADMGRGPLPDGAGKIPQITPVGGALEPNVTNGNGASE